LDPRVVKVVIEMCDFTSLRYLCKID
jgi:hypothetical protein